jgi:hypothetical protein
MSEVKSELSLVLEELALLRSDLGLSGSRAERQSDSVSRLYRSLRVFLTHEQVLRRKPYVLALDGVIQGRVSMSSTRAAIFLVLLLDLQLRLSGGQGVIDIKQRVCEAYALLEDDEGESGESLVNRMRAGFTRFASFVAGLEFLKNPWGALEYCPESCTLNLVNNGSGNQVQKLDVQVSSGDAAVSQFINQIAQASPIANLRIQKGLLLAAGDERHDVLFNELLDHSYPVRIMSSHVRPMLINHPFALLEYLGNRPLYIKRWKLAKDAFETGRLSSTEILARNSLWNIIRYKEDYGYINYPSVKDDLLITAVLDELIERLERYPNFDIRLIDIDSPMVVSNFELTLPEGADHFTFLFQRSQHVNTDFPSVLVANNVLLAGSIHDTVFEALVNHPSASKEKLEVLNLLKEIKAHFQANGPILVSES